jgi:CHRD domain
MFQHRRLLMSLALAAATVLLTAVSAFAVGGRTFVVPLAGGPLGDPDGSGLAIVQVNPGTQEVCYTITVENIGTPTEPASGLGAAHIHDRATGGIFVDLETNWTATATGFMTTGCTEADRASIIALLRDPSAYYVNIHTSAFPGGAIEGNLR